MGAARWWPRDLGVTAVASVGLLVGGWLIGPELQNLAWLCTALAFGLAVLLRLRPLRLAALTGAGLCLVVGLFDMGLSALHELTPSRSWGDHYDGYYEKRHPDLGYRPNPSQRVRAERFDVDGARLYSVAYTIDAHQTRWTPGNDLGPVATSPADDVGAPAVSAGPTSPGEPVSVEKRGTVLFLGGSFVFGEGLEDDETLPYRFSEATDHRYLVLNYGLHGFGPHQALRTVEVGLPDARIVDPVYMVYYLLLPSHLERAAGEASWDTSGPRYELTGDGVPEYRGPFWDPNNIPGMAIRQSRLYERTRGLWARSEEEKTRLAIALLVALRDRVRERYAAPLTVLYWSDESERFGRVLTAAEAAGLRVLDAFDLMPPDDVDVYTIPNDGHPNALAHRYLGPELARDFAHAHRGVSR